MIKMIKHSVIGILLLLITAGVSAQEAVIVKGKVYRADTKAPVSNASVLSVNAPKSAITAEDGSFTIQVNDKNAALIVEHNAYFKIKTALAGRTELNIYLLPTNSVMFTDIFTTPTGKKESVDKTGSSIAINKKDLNLGYASPDEALIGKIAGLQILNKSGMPGEGSWIMLRALRSMVTENTPLIVVDGMPYLPDQSSSKVIQGFSKNIFMPINLKEVESITLLKGADANSYGSLGSNGVLMIETEKATDLETKVMFHTVEGIGFMNKRIPLLDPVGFKNYIGDIGESAYTDLNALTEAYPFLKNDPDNHYNYLYDNNTDWQDEIYTTSVSTENLLKVKGGDAIANYTLSIGYLMNQGVIKNTEQTKYFTRFNSDINVTQRLKMFTSIGFNYSTHDLMEQGMIKQTNPILAALYAAPLASIYEQNSERINLPNFNSLLVSKFSTSNPSAVVSDVAARNKAYDLLINAGLSYQITGALRFNAMVGLYYNYTQESLFIPGRTSSAIAPSVIDYEIARNIVRHGVGEGLNYYGNGILQYNKTFDNIHSLNVALGYQMIMSKKEFDCGSGFNTTSDFYRSLSSVTTISRKIVGSLDEWNWMNTYLLADYNFKSIYSLGISAAVDASSSYGSNSGRFFVLPAVKAAWNLKSTAILRDMDAVSGLKLRGEYGMTGNSRYSSKLSRYYYTSISFRDIAGIVRAGLPNSNLGPEKVWNANVGLDFALVGNRFNLSIDLFEERTKEMLIEKHVGGGYGYDFIYDNVGEMRTRGAEVNLIANLIQTDHLGWTIGVNIATAKPEVISLGGPSESIVTFSDGTKLISKVGEMPYSFYGYQVEKVFTSRQEAKATGYVSHAGIPFEAGDIKFKDVTPDKVIDGKDMVNLGNPNPDFFGGFFTNIRYKNINLYANFTYSYGNEIYNAVRRGTESMTEFSNQTSVVARRWTYDGQSTDIPKASYGDPNGNSRFSSRWIEDGSYMKLKEITLSYQTGKKFLFFNSVKVYLTGENLLTFTKYHGLDPEFSYSYDPQMSGMDLGKVPLAKSGRLGFILNF